MRRVCCRCALASPRNLRQPKPSIMREPSIQASPMSHPFIERGKRVVLAGRTGSGKSTLACWLMRHSDVRWLILNPKATGAYDNLDDCERVNGIDPRGITRAIERSRYVNIVPNYVESTPEGMDALIEWIHHSFDGVGLCADELYTLHEQRHASAELTTYLTQNHERGQSFLEQTQRPAWISRFIFSEANYISEMALNLLDDRKRMFQFIGHEIGRAHV